MLRVNGKEKKMKNDRSTAGEKERGRERILFKNGQINWISLLQK